MLSDLTFHSHSHSNMSSCIPLTPTDPGAVPPLLWMGCCQSASRQVFQVVSICLQGGGGGDSCSHSQFFNHSITIPFLVIVGLYFTGVLIWAGIAEEENRVECHGTLKMSSLKCMCSYHFVFLYPLLSQNINGSCLVCPTFCLPSCS